MSVRDVLIVGAGPSGLATAIAAKQHGLDYVVVEKGVLVNSVFHFPVYMVFFTTPELLEIGRLPLVTPFEKPTRLEALRYYRRVVDTYGLQISFHEEVASISSSDGGAGAPSTVRASTVGASTLGASTVGASTVGAGFSRPEAVFAVETMDRRGTRRVRHARAVVLAIGYYDHPNMLNVPGENLPHVSHYYDEAHPYYRQRVVVVGGKNSSAEAALELFRAGAHVTLVHRRSTLGDSIKYWVKPDIENRIKEGSIGARFDASVKEITTSFVAIERNGTREELPAERVFLLTGYHPDVDLMRRAGVRYDPETLAPEYDAQTFETTVPNLFVAGGAVAGRHTGTIFIENGRFHGEKIISVLAERLRTA